MVVNGEKAVERGPRPKRQYKTDGNSAVFKQQIALGRLGGKQESCENPWG